MWPRFTRDATCDRSLRMFNMWAILRCSVHAEKYLDFVFDTVVPWVASRFRVDVSSAEHIGMIGSSLGGYVVGYEWRARH